MDENLLNFKEKRAKSEQELDNAQAALKEAVKQGKNESCSRTPCGLL